MTVNTTVRHFSKNSTQATSHAASSNSDQACEIAADSAVEITAKALAYIFIFLVSFFGNIFLLVVIYKNKQLRRSINYFVFNMAISDLFNPLTIMTVKIVEIISGSSSWKVDRPSAGKHSMQTCLFSARCFSRNFHRKPSLDLHRQAHRCRLSAEGQTYLLKSTIDKHFKHVVCRHRRPRTLFLQFQTDPRRK